MIRPITDTLRHIGGGVFIDLASDKLSELVAAVDSSGKSGKIDLTITVKKATRGGAMHISGKVKLPSRQKRQWKRFCSPPQKETWLQKTRTSKNLTSNQLLAPQTPSQRLSRPHKDQT